MQFGSHCRFCAPLSVGALAVVLLTGCGSSPSASTGPGTVSASSYVGAVCTSVASWYRGLQEHTRSLSHEVTPSTPPGTGKKALESFVNVSVEETESATTALRAAGVPNVSNGPKIAHALVSAFERATSTLKGLQSGVNTMHPSSSAVVNAEAKHVGSSAQSLPLELTTGFAGLTSSELSKAAAQSQTCKSVGARPKS